MPAASAAVGGAPLAGTALLELRDREPERFLCAMFAPRDRRDAILALILLHRELAGIGQRTSERMPALIRLQWWRDAIEATAGGQPPSQPVLQALARPLLGGQLAASDLVDLVDGHEERLESTPVTDLPVLLRGVRITAGRSQVIWAKALGCGGEPWLERAAIAGTALGLVELAQTWATRPTPPVVPLPPGRRVEGGANAAPPTDGATRRAVVTTLLAQVDPLIGAATAGRPPAAWLSALLPARVARLHAATLRRATALPVTAEALRSPWLAPALLAAWMRGRP